MCGFVGLIDYRKKSPIDSELLKKMNRKLAHRGPDDEGYFIHENVGLAHRRLSIIDTSPAGRQPIFNESKTVAAILNGEIYNFLELKKKLIKCGHRFYSKADSEVLVHAYEEWEDDFIQKLDGMFSLALYNTKNAKIFLATDPFGKKPLYYSLQNGVFFFGSELKAFFPHPAFEKKLDSLSLFKYLTHDYVPAPATIFEKCHKLPSASVLIINTDSMAQNIQSMKYWRLNYQPKSKLSEKEAQERLKLLLGKAVNKRLISDVPLGIFLSGGVDSSIVVSLAAEYLPAKQIKTFSIGFKEKSFDESGYARCVARYFGTDHHEKIFSALQAAEILPEVVEKLDEPFADASILPTYLLCRFVRETITVALGGDGGDEIFAGYDPFGAHKAIEMLPIMPDMLIRILRRICSFLPSSDKNMSMGFILYHFLKGLTPYTKNNPALRNALWMGPFPFDGASCLLNPDQFDSITFEQVFKETLMLNPHADKSNSMDRVIDHFINLYLQNDILVKVDRASMMNSLEVRAPFLDKSFTEFVAGLPENYKMKRFSRKYLLKKTFACNLPPEIINRKKKGFGIPVVGWLKGQLKEQLLDCLSETRIKAENIFNPKAVQKLLSDFMKNRTENRKELWALFIFQLWKEHHTNR